MPTDPKKEDTKPLVPEKKKPGRKKKEVVPIKPITKEKKDVVVTFE